MECIDTPRSELWFARVKFRSSLLWLDLEGVPGE